MRIETKHRILGVLVVIGLVIILLPFFQGRKELLPESTIAKAPPFPDQSIQITAAVPDENEPVNPQPDDIISVAHPNIVNADSPSVLKRNIQIDHTSVNKTTETADNTKKQVKDNTLKLPNIKKTNLANVKKVSRDPKLQFESSLQASIDDDGLAKLNNAAWVVQIGSFKNKANALRLVNQLRSNGYKAFIQQVSTTFGTSTRVFVGPEAKRTMAHTVASRLEKDMHIQGVVISYQPLTL